MFRATGHQPLLNFSWIYPHSLDESDVEQFNQRLSQGFLGRLLQRSSLPGGRHHWVANPYPAPVTWLRDPIPVEALPKWQNSLMDLAVDPEYGPGWRLAVQSLEGGGSVLSLVISHTLADGMAAVQAISDAVTGKRMSFSFPARLARWSPARLLRDSVVSARALPDVWRALKTLLRWERNKSATAIAIPFTPRLAGCENFKLEPPIIVPLVFISIERPPCKKRAEDLGININTLLSVFAARLAYRLGRVDASGRVELVLPFSDRQPGEWRGNAFKPLSVMIHPGACHENPHELRRDIRTARESGEHQNLNLQVLLPLMLYTPLWMLRDLAKQSFSERLPVNCSLLGQLPPELSSPCGEASQLVLSNLERWNSADAERMGGGVFVVGYILRGKVVLTVSAYLPNRITTDTELIPFVQDAMKDLGLEGTIGGMSRLLFKSG